MPKVSQVIDKADSATEEDSRSSPLFRHAVFCLLMAFIYLGPAPGQLFGAHSPWLREWIMFSGVGIGIPVGSFTVTEADGTKETYTPLEAAGLERYPTILHYQFQGRIFAPDDLGRFANSLCARTPDTSVVSFDGSVGSRDGWLPMQAEGICKETDAGS